MMLTPTDQGRVLPCQALLAEVEHCDSECGAMSEQTIIERAITSRLRADPL